MKHGRILAATLAIAGGLTLGLGAGASSASAQTMICAPGYHLDANYGCMPDQMAYYPSTVYVSPPAMYDYDFHNSINGGDHQHGHFEH